MKKIIAYYITIGFILNFIWEVSQVGLYNSHFEGVRGFIMVHLKAILGDVAILLIIYLIASLIYMDRKWIEKNKIGLYAFVTIMGFAFAVVIEKYALIVGRWGYNELMPIIPFLNVGIIPVLQLVIIVPLSVFLTVMITEVEINKGKEV